MKNLLTTLLLILGFTISSKSQVTVDFIAGAGNSSFTETAVKTDTSFHSSKLSFFAGANAKMNIFSDFYAGASLTYAAKGAKYNSTGTNWSYNYVDFAGNIYYNVNSLYIGVGAQVGYLINSNEALVRENYSFINLAERKVDFGINLDLQYYLTEKILIGGNFYYGLNDVYNVHLLTEAGNSAGQYYTQNMNYALYLGYKILD